MNQLQIFESPDFGQIRTMEIDSKPYFVALDVTKALGYSSSRHAIKQHVDNEDAQKKHIRDNQGFFQNTILINESGLYALIFGSKLPTAKAYKRWVTNEVLPEIRKNGGYLITKMDDTAETVIQRSQKVLQASFERLAIENQQLRIENKQKDELLAEYKPIVKYAYEALDYGTSYSANQIGKGLGLNGRKLNRRLKALGVQYKQGNTWLLYAKYENRNFMKLVPIRIKTRQGKTYSIIRSKWTETGRAFIHQLNREGKV